MAARVSTSKYTYTVGALATIAELEDPIEVHGGEGIVGWILPGATEGMEKTGSFSYEPAPGETCLRHRRVWVSGRPP